MVCPYCSNSTKVTNSRHQARSNGVWRRRSCLSCSASWTTNEQINNSTALKLEDNGKIQPFSRDILLLSIYDAQKHSKTAQKDSEHLTDTIINKVSKRKSAFIERSELVSIATKVLKAYDPIAGSVYEALHKS